MSSLITSSYTANRLFSNADITVGDKNIIFTFTSNNEALTGKSISFVFIKPSGGNKTVTATVIGTFTAEWTATATTDFTEEGLWYITALNNTDGYYYTKEENNSFICRRKPGGSL